MISPAWPTVSLVLATAVMLGGLVDLAGGRSWVRALTPRRGHRNVLLWSETKAPDPDPGPWPGTSHGPDQRQQVLLLVPDHPSGGELSNITALGAFFGLVALGTILGCRMVDTPTSWSALAGTTTCLLVVSLVSVGFNRRPKSPRAAPGIAAARAIVEQLPRSLPARVGIVIVGGLGPWFDGVEVLLSARKRRLPPQRTDIIVWHPGDGPVAKVTRDGLFRRPAHTRIIDAAESLPEANPRRLRPWRTGALRARRMGWPALGLVGGANDPPTIDAITALLETLAHRP